MDSRATADADRQLAAITLAALVGAPRSASVVWAIALPMAGGQLCGGFLGARLALKGGARFVRLAVVVP